MGKILPGDMTGGWDIERLDLDAYLQRIGHDTAVSPTADALAALQRAHVASIPFENLDIVLGRGIAVDLESVQEKLVERRRSGYCYEHGVLFAGALERLGFRVERMLARVGGEELQRPRAKTHMTVRARRGRPVAGRRRSPFVGKLVAARRDEDALRRLVGRTFTLERPDGSVEEREVGDEELAGLLRGVFAISLSDGEVERLTFVS